MARPNPKRIGILGYDDVAALDIVGPAEAFASAGCPLDEIAPTPCYEIIVMGLTHRPFTAESGIVFQPRCSIADAPALDTLIIPGGRAMREPKVGAAVAARILRRAPRTRRIASVCTGIYGLAATGLLDGRRVTTHWRFAQDLAARFPLLKVDPDPLFLKDGAFYTSAGSTAGIDLALALIEEDYGRRVALAVAREMVVYLKRLGGQQQFSEPLQFQTQAADRFTDIAAWIASNLDADLSVETLASKAALCPRHFRRRFKSTFGRNPATYVEGLRLGEVRNRLMTTGQTVEAIAASVGFGDADSLRRIFRRRYGIPPGDYRERFNSSRGGPTDSGSVLARL